MITAQQARDLVAAKQDVADQLSYLTDQITQAANLGLLYVEEQYDDQLQGVQLESLLQNYGFDVHYESHRHILKIQW